MRLLAIFSVLLSAAASLTLHKTDGTTIELGDEPMVVDLSNVIMPALAPVTDSNIHNTPHVANTADWDHSACNLYVWEHANYKGFLTTAYRCTEGINGCMSLISDDLRPTASSLELKGCPDGSPNHGRNFYCFFFSTGACEASARTFFARSGTPVGNLADYDWNDKIRSVSCHWDF